MNNIIKRTWRQGSMVIIEDLRGVAFQAEENGHTFEISAIDRDGEPVALSGTSAGVMLRCDNQDVALTCAVSDGKVTATLPANAYAVPGRFALTIFLTSGGQKVAIYAAVGTVKKTNSGTVAPPAGDDVTDLISRINTAINAIPVNYNAAFAVAYENLPFPVTEGTYCIYDGALKRAVVDIATSETYTAAHWTNANFGQDLNSLKSAFNRVVIGNLVGSETNVYYPIPKIVAGDKIVISTGNGQAVTADMYFRFYDENKNLLNTASYGPNTGISRTLDTANGWSSIVGACYILQYGSASYPYQVEFGQKTGYKPYNPVNIETDREKLKTYGKNIADLLYVSYRKNLIGNEANVLYPFAPIVSGDKVVISTGNGSATDAQYDFSFYNSSKTLLATATFGVNTGTSRTLDTLGDWSSIIGACYVSISAKATVPFQVEVANAKTTYQEYYPNTLRINEKVDELRVDLTAEAEIRQTQIDDINKNVKRTVTSDVANGTAWNPYNANSVCTEGYIDVSPGELISMTVNTFPDDGCYYGFGFVTYDSTKTYKRSIDAVASRRAIRDLIIETGEKYIRFTVAQFKQDGTVLAKRKTDYQSNDFVYYIKTNELPIIDQHSVWMQQAKRITYATTNSPIQSIQNLLGFIYLSDVHGDTDNIKRILDVGKMFPDYFNDIIHTGDSVFTYIEAGNPFESVAGGDTVLNVIGNHDCWHQGDGGYYGTKQEAYDLIIKNNVSAWGVTQPTGASENFDCYYYKDYTTNKFRLIVLDCMHWDTTQASWFETVLGEAKTNSLAVIIAEHYPPANGLTSISCPFMSLALNLTPSEAERFTDDAFDLVDSFIDGGGEFVCWIAGHLHADFIGTVTGHTNQLMIGIENAGTGVLNLDDNRIKGTPTQDCFNYITFDKTNKLVRIVRIGCNSDEFMRKKDTLCVNYSTKSIIC